MAATAAPATTVGTPPAPTTTARATRAAGRTTRPASECESARCWPACCQVAMHPHDASPRMPGQPAHLPGAGWGGVPVGCRCRCNILAADKLRCPALPCCFHVLLFCAFRSDHSAYDWWTFGSNPPSQVRQCAHSAALRLQHNNPAHTPHPPTHHPPTHPPPAQPPCLQEACCNFPDDVLQEARPSLPRCVGCNRQVDTAAEAHSYGAGGLCCMACMYTT